MWRLLLSSIAIYLMILAVFNFYNMWRLLLCSISTICDECCYVPSLQYVKIVSGGAGTVNPSEAAGHFSPSDIGNLSRMLLFRLNPMVFLLLMAHILFGFPVPLTLSVADENHFRHAIIYPPPHFSENYFAEVKIKQLKRELIYLNEWFIFIFIDIYNN